jgi:hypothetical protein
MIDYASNKPRGPPATRYGHIRRFILGTLMPVGFWAHIILSLMLGSYCG